MTDAPLFWSNDVPAGGYGGRRVRSLKAGEQFLGVVIQHSDGKAFRAELYDGCQEEGSSVSRALKCDGKQDDAERVLLAAVEAELPGATRCKWCGQLELPWAKIGRKYRPEVCSRCSHWLNHIEMRNRTPYGPTQFMANGESYEMSQEFPRGHSGGLRGFGGTAFVVLFDDGRQIYTTNLFVGGKCPAALRHLCPDTATFYKMDQDFRMKALSLPECRCKALPFAHVCLQEPLSAFAIVKHV
jgi:hypothetical protein